MIESYHYDYKKRLGVRTISSLYVEFDSIAAVSIECYKPWDEEKQAKVEIMNVVTSCKETISTESIGQTLLRLASTCYMNRSFYYDIYDIVRDYNYKIEKLNKQAEFNYWNQERPDKDKKPIPKPSLGYYYFYPVEWDENEFKTSISKIVRRLNDGVLKISDEFTDLLNELERYPKPLDPENPTFYHLHALGIAMLQVDELINWV